MRNLKRGLHACFGAFGLAILTSGAALADNCDQPNLTGFDSVYCFAKIYVGEDAVLNERYGELRGMLSSSERQTLLGAQRNWISARDAACMSAPTTVNVNCALRMTRDRANFLSARMTECRTVGCAASKLDDY